MSSKRASLFSVCGAGYQRFTLGALSFVAVTAAVAGGCSSDDDHPTAPVASAGAGGRGTPPAAAGKSNDGGGGAPQEAAGSGGSPTEAEAGWPSSAGAGGKSDAPEPGGTAGDPGLPLETCPSDKASAPPSFQGVCAIGKGWAAGTGVAAASGDSPTFVAVTPDELTLLWSEPQSSRPAYFLADRAAVEDVFAEPQELPFLDVIGVSPDGLRLTLRSSEGRLTEATRDARGDSFGEPTPGSFASLDEDAATHHWVLGDVAISADDRTLFYSARSLEDATRYPVRVSNRAGDGPWPVGAVVEACELQAYADFGPHPSAISADGLTLFYIDAARGQARAAFRTSPGADFSWFEDLPGLTGAQPNAACDAVYYSPPTGKPTLLRAARK